MSEKGEQANPLSLGFFITKNKPISQEIHRHLFTSGSASGMLNRLTKVHKSNCPARPTL